MFKLILFTTLLAIAAAKPGIHSVAYPSTYIGSPVPAAYTAPVAAAPVVAAYTAPVAAFRAPATAFSNAEVAAAYTNPAAAYPSPYASAYTALYSGPVPAAYTSPYAAAYTTFSRQLPAFAAPVADPFGNTVFLK